MDALWKKYLTPTEISRRPVLIAVSGGSDSVALLHWMAKRFPGRQLHVATVDHQLRVESADEAAMVARTCSGLGLPHDILRWQPEGTASSAMARDARYALLRAFADKIEADVIVLGHTLDDQAETVFMRAQRVRKDSDTRGLSGIAEWSSFNGIRLWRPLLDQSRNQLRQNLTDRKLGWVDDPSNEDQRYERVRVRKLLSSAGNDSLPASKELARLAELSSRSRRWMNWQVADYIKDHACIKTDGLISLVRGAELPRSILLEILSLLVLVAGGLAHRSPTSKLAEIADAVKANGETKITLGRCLVSTRNGLIKVQREARNLPPIPAQVDDTVIFDGRIQIEPSRPGAPPVQKPFISSLEYYRPETDDLIYAALMELLDSTAHST